jgi:hypothetical protein
VKRFILLLLGLALFLGACSKLNKAPTAPDTITIDRTKPEVPLGAAAPDPNVIAVELQNNVPITGLSVPREPLCSTPSSCPRVSRARRSRSPAAAVTATSM